MHGIDDHIKFDISCLSEKDCLLAIDVLSKFVKCADKPSWEGAYLYYDTVRGVFIRSGKVTGRGMKKRDDEHLTCAKAKRASSKLYEWFPSVHSPRASSKNKKGYFESLMQVVAAGFDGTGEAGKYVDKDHKNGGFLIMSEKEKGFVKSSMNNLNCTELEKFYHFLSYQMELGYELALSPKNDVSQSQGFEAMLGLGGSDE